MNFVPKLPTNSQKLKQILAKAHRHCQEMELAGLQLENIISQLEHENRQRRIQHLGKELHKENF